MFDILDEAGLVATVEEAARAEAAAAALRLSAIGELTARRVGEDPDDPRAFWACDGWDSAAAEVAAAMNISPRKASGQMRIAEALRDQLPSVAALFCRGEVSARVVGAITWRTQLITEEAVWAVIDRAIVQRAGRWGPLSEDKLVAAVDALVLEFDEDALIQPKTAARTRDFYVGDREDETGVTSVWGRLNAADAAVLKKKVAAMVATVCDNDPRTMNERRAMRWGRGATATIICRVRADHRTARPAEASRRPSPRWSSMCTPTKTPSRVCRAGEPRPPHPRPPHPRPPRRRPRRRRARPCCRVLR